MGGARAQARPTSGPHLLLYVGTCGLCNDIVRAVLLRDRQGVFHFGSLQSTAGIEALSRFGCDSAGLDTFVAIANYRSPSAACLIRARAAIFVLTSLGWPWRAAAPLGLLPRALLDAAYYLVARNRYRFFPRVEHCLVPRPEYRDRFLDAGGTDSPDQEVS